MWALVALVEVWRSCAVRGQWSQLSRKVRDFPGGVQWLRLRTSTAGAVGSIPGRGTKVPHATWCSQKKKESDVSQFTFLTITLMTVWRGEELKAGKSAVGEDCSIQLRRGGGNEVMLTQNRKSVSQLQFIFLVFCLVMFGATSASSCSYLICKIFSRFSNGTSFSFSS